VLRRKPTTRRIQQAPDAAIQNDTRVTTSADAAKHLTAQSGMVAVDIDDNAVEAQKSSPASRLRQTLCASSESVTPIAARVESA